jgi:hypothetical protein
VPIKPENAVRYPKNWKEVRERILARAGNRCEGSPAFPLCRVPNGWLRNNRTGELTDDGLLAESWELVDLDPVTKIVLTIGHLDHTPENCAEENLRAWCQRCHLNYDHDLHQQNAYQTRRKNKAVKELF